MASGKFSIDDAFQSDDDDPIRLYGSTTDSVPLRGKRRPSESDSRSERQSNREVDVDGGLPTTKTDGRIYTGLLSSSTHSMNSSLSEGFSVSAKTFPEKRWWRHPKVRENWRIVLASFILTVVGLGLLVAGVVIEVSDTKAVQSFIFFIAGAICLIPGAYHVIYIYCAVKGKRGFSFYNLPVFK